MTVNLKRQDDFEMEIVKQPNGTYTIVDKPQPQVNLKLLAAVIQTVRAAQSAARKPASIEFKAPQPARLDGDAHARIDAAMAKRARKAAKLKNKAEGQ